VASICDDVEKVGEGIRPQSKGYSVCVVPIMVSQVNYSTVR
jgi:hypothetical protein